MTRIQNRRATAAEWAAANPVLADGEIGYERVTGRIKVGDGTTAWNSLGLLVTPSKIGAVKQTEPADMASIFGAAIIKNATRDWHGESYNIGDVANSFGWSGSPYVTPATTITADVTFPLFNATIPVADCAQLLPGGGSFLLGGKRVAYLGRSAASGAGNATGCYSTAASTGTVASGTTPVLSPTGFMALAVYKRFGYDGRPIVGSTQAFTAIAAYRSPTVDDSAEAGAFLVTLGDSGSPQVQNLTVTGGEMTAQLGGNWTMPGGDPAALCGGGVRSYLTATDRAKNAMGLKISLDHAGYADNYDGIYQTSKGYNFHCLVNGAVTAGSNKTISFDGATKRPPTPTTGFPGSVVIGANADGIGGQSVSYTGITGTGSTGTLTGATVTFDIADNARIGNRAFGARFRDQVTSTAGFGLGDTGYSGAVNLTLRGNPDSISSMFSITGPTTADSQAGGLCLVRLNAGSDQTNSILQVFDTGGSNRLSISAAGALISRQQMTIQTSLGVNVASMLSTGLRIGNPTTGLACNLTSGSGAPTASGSAGDAYFRTDTPATANQRLYICTGTTNWTGIL